jgi:hypothetical protein
MQGKVLAYVYEIFHKFLQLAIHLLALWQMHQIIEGSKDMNYLCTKNIQMHPWFTQFIETHGGTSLKNVKM